MAMTVMPILGFTGVAGADHLETADPVGEDNVCEDAPEEDPFTDVSDEDPAVEVIRCLVNVDITEGTGDGDTYSPNAPVTRRQMALFLERIADLAEANEVDDEVQALPEGDGDTPFTDIGDEAAEIQNAIDRLHEAGITDGVTETEFRPNAPVTRRQMAKFLVDLQAYVAGEDFAPEPTEDYFADDEGDTGEEELNVLAEEGVFIGGDDEHNVDPGEDITRRQMASVLTRKAEVLFEAEVINRLFEEDDTNQTFEVTPTEDVQQEFGTTRTYTAQIGDTEDVSIALIACDNVIVDENGTVSFYDADDNDDPDDITGEAVQSEITMVNGVAVTPGTTQEDIEGTNGTVSFTVSGAETYECVIPLVSDDESAEFLNEEDQPVDPFGIGGSVTFVPAEAEQGTTAAFDGVRVADVFNEDDSFVGEDNGEYYLFRYDSSDDFEVQPQADDFSYDDAPSMFGGEATQQATLTGFEENVSEGDWVAIADYQPNPDLDSGFSIEFNTPVTPDVVTSLDPQDDGTTDVVTMVEPDYPVFEEMDPDDAFVVLRAELDPDADEVAGCSMADAADLGEDDFTSLAMQTKSAALLAGNIDAGAFVHTDEDPGPGCYLYAGAVVVDGDASPLGADLANSWGGVDGDGAPTVVPDPANAPTIEDADLTLDTVVTDAADTADVWTLTFNEEMDPATLPNSQFALVDDDAEGGDAILVECDSTDALDTAVTGATCTLDAGADGDVDFDTLEIVLDEAAEDRNALGNGAIIYPLTITGVSGLLDADDGAGVNVAGSSDVTIG